MTDNSVTATDWLLRPLAAFDLETTGVDLEQDRIVTAAVIETAADGTPTAEWSWLVDPGVEIPEAAAAIHGVTTERAVAEGVPAAGAVAEITGVLERILSSGTPLAIMNAPFDLTILDRECRRHGVVPLSERLTELGPVLDPLVLDKHVDRYRKGKRNLEALCAHYRVRHGGAHEAGADAAAAAAVTRRIGRSASRLAGMSPSELHGLQVRAAADQAASFQAYLRRSGRTDALIDPSWPLSPVPSDAV
ncbi:exonuclease domain-containing protein [Actinorugispora endophytica]|uniref:DNA polymerase-3 subunit epsilon n=1 Tax=Actinorugispora endophytica TaxID=1605990 RepID=A0A4R6V4N7_9ACTN|nr:exonuclease domain-containing protein [Actinorugispora endophytica]TDQ55244.1 DNA polymerase-3 subunit epsilon [Actinorugispora endophytica]